MADFLGQHSTKGVFLAFRTKHGTIQQLLSLEGPAGLASQPSSQVIRCKAGNEHVSEQHSRAGDNDSPSRMGQVVLPLRSGQRMPEDTQPARRKDTLHNALLSPSGFRAPPRHHPPAAPTFNCAAGVPGATCRTQRSCQDPQQLVCILGGMASWLFASCPKVDLNSHHSSFGRKIIRKLVKHFLAQVMLTAILKKKTKKLIVSHNNAMCKGWNQLLCSVARSVTRSACALISQQHKPREGRTAAQGAAELTFLYTHFLRMIF